MHLGYPEAGGLGSALEEHLDGEGVREHPRLLVVGQDDHPVVVLAPGVFVHCVREATFQHSRENVHHLFTKNCKK